MMTEKEFQLIAMMLEAYSEQRGNAGCNDLPSKWAALFTSEEHRELSRQFHCMNGDPQDDTGSLADFCLISLMANKVRAHASQAR